MREQFEKLPEIAEILHTVVYNEDLNQYHAAMINSGLSVKYIQGAWYAFQEQQKKIDDLNLKIQDLASKYEGKTTLPILDQWSDCFVKSAKVIVNDLKGLLK